MSMQVSIQTDRKKRNNFENTNLKPEISSRVEVVEEETEKQRERKIKKLTLINRQLIETLKKQNDQLTKKINKQKNKGQIRSTSFVENQIPKNLEKTKKELANAYKQIEMYKSVLQNLKAKQISTESADKLTQLENKIKYEDSVIEQLQKQLKYVKNIKDQQEKELNIFENEDVKTSVVELEEELKKLKEKLREAKKQAKKREDLEKKQHLYYMELQKALRKQNDQYYPGKTDVKKQIKKQGDQQDISERQWQLMRIQLAELKKNHEENNKKIEQLNRQRNKELKSAEENQIKLKDRLRKLNIVKTKISEVTKLVKMKDSNSLPEDQINEEDEEDGQKKYESVMKNGKKVYKSKNPENDREVKKWVIPHGYCMEKGKILPDSMFFSDKTNLKNVKKSKIIQIHIWVDSADKPNLLQFIYLSENDKRFDGIQPYSVSSLTNLQEKIIKFKEGDYLSKIKGKFEDGFLSSITFISKFGKKQTFGEESGGEDFKFDPRPNEIPGCIFGAFIKSENDEIKICHLGCEFTPDW